MAAAVLATGSLAGCVTSAGSAESDEPTPDAFDGWLDDANGYDGVVDRTDRSVVTVAVGGDPDMAFHPAAVRVDAGTTVRWEWAGGGSVHNVAAADGRFESEYYSEAGAAYDRSFNEPGVVKYQCVPHAYAGMKGVVVVV